MTSVLILPSFIAGFLTFIAPCTLPIIPAFLSFISGVSFTDALAAGDEKSIKRRLRLHALLYVVGFSIVFIVLGSLAGLTGHVFSAYQVVLARLGGIFIALFGFFMMSSLLSGPLQAVTSFQGRLLKPITAKIKPGTSLGSFLFGGVFALGFTPCIGPVLGAVLTLAATTTTVSQGAFLLFIFSLGFGIPFLFIAWSLSSASKYIKQLERYEPYLNGIGGFLLIVMGLLMFANAFGLLTNVVNVLFSASYYEALLPYF